MVTNQSTITKQLMTDRSYSDKYISVYRQALGFSDFKPMCVKTVTFIVTEDCNLGCTYCYQVNKKKSTMTIETAKKAVDLLFEEDARNSDYVNEENAESVIIDFIGGEPLLAIDTVTFTMEYFLMKAISLKHRWAENVMFSITTNGTLYHNKKFQRLIALYPDKLSIGITIDGNEELHDSCRVYKNSTIGSYKDVERAYRDYLKLNPYAATKLTVAPPNVTYLYDGLVNCVDNLGLKIVNANTVYEKGWGLSHAKELYKQLKKCADWIIGNDLETEIVFSFFTNTIGQPMDENENQNWCGGTGAMMAVDPSGQITPCLRYSSLSLPCGVEPLEIGTLDKKIGEEEEHAHTIKELNTITRRSQSTDECFNCPIASGCGWCSAYNYEVFGTANKRATYNCVMHKARVLANVYYWNSMYRKHNEDTRFAHNIFDAWALEIISEDELHMLKELAKND